MTNYNNKMNHSLTKKKKYRQFLMLYLILFTVVACIIVLFFVIQYKKNTSSSDTTQIASGQAVDNTNNDAKPVNAGSSELADQSTRDSMLSQAASLATGYDYDGAIKLLKSKDGYEQYQDLLGKINEYETTKANLVEVDITQVPHLFTHPLVYDAAVGFASDNLDAYQQESLTVTEFKNFLQQMYDNNYVLVGLHDLCTVVKSKSGKKKLKQNTILLPAGKKAFIFSEDDTNYYERWQGKGVSSRLTIGTDGKITNEVDLADGSKIQGDYDVAPILETFIKEHPDFSYQGARATLAVTGREGVWGYRTSKYVPGEDNDSSVNSEKDFDINNEDSQKAIAVSQALVNQGFELGSHSFIHAGLGSCSMHCLKYDIKRWETECESLLLGDVDTILYPLGQDIEHGEDGWKYKLSNQRFKSLYNAGFVFLCNVDSNESSPWETIGSNYLRGRRVGLIGKTVLCDVDYMKRNFNLDMNTIIDAERPVPKYLTYNGVKIKTTVKKK